MADKVGNGMRRYVGVIHKENDSDFGLSFPDFPGVITAGRTMAEVRRLAEMALAFHVEGLIEDDGSVPEPTPLEHVVAEGDVLGTVRVRLKLQSS
ncbi:type II toxin-antitoxin system HicB family antitoxin [Mesorhizobium sp. VK4C]|uniref:type II toxin-antitoxin system HicB family antitoxin n=1 Tax=Mesorhizobium captivum TaxID=3072319 RepID=UPI002A242CA6|nr:type II toxin-antitoxin system HicB family antitoxin [Mesorhizobium sp. VK4C]MDX8500617.1 type II toxin-antitoxin system HicB family antitoxin [Mesorhizobium sp. VK4C]